SRCSTGIACRFGAHQGSFGFRSRGDEPGSGLAGASRAGLSPLIFPGRVSCFTCKAEPKGHDQPSPREGSVMTRLPSQIRYGDWIIYVALLPALFTLAGLAVTAAIAWHNQSLWNANALSAIPGDADDYVQGLAKRGIIELPGYEPPSAVDLVSRR